MRGNTLLTPILGGGGNPLLVGVTPIHPPIEAVLAGLRAGLTESGHMHTIGADSAGNGPVRRIPVR